MCWRKYRYLFTEFSTYTIIYMLPEMTTVFIPTHRPDVTCLGFLHPASRVVWEFDPPSSSRCSPVKRGLSHKIGNSLVQNTDIFRLACTHSSVTWSSPVFRIRKDELRIRIIKFNIWNLGLALSLAPYRKLERVLEKKMFQYTNMSYINLYF